MFLHEKSRTGHARTGCETGYPRAQVDRLGLVQLLRLQKLHVRIVAIHWAESHQQIAGDSALFVVPPRGMDPFGNLLTLI